MRALLGRGWGLDMQLWYSVDLVGGASDCGAGELVPSMTSASGADTKNGIARTGPEGSSYT